MSAATAGQIFVSIILGVVVGLLAAAGLLSVYWQYQENKESDLRREQLRKRAAPEPHDVRPWNPDRCEDDEIIGSKP